VGKKEKVSRCLPVSNHPLGVFLNDINPHADAVFFNTIGSDILTSGRREPLLRNLNEPG
jgi:hypothetical protein